MKMYILVKNDVPLGLAVNAVGHASLSCYLMFNEHPSMDKWLKESFKKVTCKVTSEEFEQAKKEFGDYVMIGESSIDRADVALAFRPQEEYPPFFKTLKLFR